MTRDDLRALMAAIISTQYAPDAVSAADRILAETHPDLPMVHELTIAPGPHSVYSNGSPVPTGHGDIVYVRSGASISHGTGPCPQCGRGICAGCAPPERAESERTLATPPEGAPRIGRAEMWRRLVAEENGEYTVYCDYAGTRHRINAEDFVNNIAARARAEVLEEVRRVAEEEITKLMAGNFRLPYTTLLGRIFDRLSSEGADDEG